MAAQLIYGAGALALATPTGSELVDLDNGGAVKIRATVQAIAKLAATGSSTAVLTTISTVGNGTITAAGIVGRVVSRTGTQVGAISDSTDTAANIAAALPSGVTYPVSWEMVILNNTTASAPAQDTIAAGVGVTLSGKVNATPAIVLGPNCLARILVTMTSATACTMYVQSIEDIGIDNFNATTDPGVSNDNTQGYGPGSQWINTSNNREWTCVSAATGGAVWSFSGAVLGSTEPSGIVTQFGSGTGGFLEEGNIFRQISVPAVNPGSTNNDNVLAFFTLPANSFDGTGNRGLMLTANGLFASNTNSKRVKLWATATLPTVGSAIGGSPSLLCDSAAYTTTGAAQFQVSAQLFKYGAANSNTQETFGAQVIINATHSGFGAGASAVPQSLTLTENAAIYLVVTGNAVTTATDVGLNAFEINAMN